MTPILLVMALVLFMFDIAIRRLNLPIAVLEDKLSALRPRLQPKKKVKKSPGSVVGAGITEESKTKLQPKQEEKAEIKAEVKKARTEKPEIESLDTSALLKKKKKREE